MTPLDPLDPLIVWIATAALAVLFAHAAVSKLGDLPLFEQHLAAYGTPAALLSLATRALPLAEAAAAVLLLTPWRPAGALLAAALLALYGAAMAWQRSRGRVLDCGCGGAPLPLSWALVLRNVLLMALALGAAAAPMAARTLALADFMVIAAAVLLASLLHAALHQVLRHQAGLRTRRVGRTV